MSDISEWAEQFRIGEEHRKTPAGLKDLSRVSLAFRKFARVLPKMLGPAIEAEKEGRINDIQDVLTFVERCENLRTGDFSKEAFESLPGFRELMRLCRREDMDLAPRISVVRRNDFVLAVPEDQAREEAAVLLRIYPPQKYRDGYLDIAKDETIGLPDQFWTPEQIVIADEKPSAPARLVKPLKVKFGPSPYS